MGQADSPARAPAGVPVLAQAGRSASRRQGGLRLAWLWLAFFGYTLAVGFLVQLVLLPRVLPALHWRADLLTGPDSTTFHQLAVYRAARIRAEGWGTWEVRPYGHAPVGLASAVYALAGPEPWALVPIHAAAHATSALLLLAVVETFARPRVALLATLPFLLYPSATSLYTQLHKDGWFILGALLFAYGWLGLARPGAWSGPGVPLRSAAWVWLGSLLIWIMRPYGALLLQALGFLLAFLLTAALGLRVRRSGLSWRRAAAAAALAWLMVGGVTVLARQELPVMEYVAVGEPEFGRAAGSRIGRWQRWRWLPAFLDYRLRELAVVRDNYRLGYPEAGLNIDTDVAFRSPADILAYLPRAAAIVLFAPFPAQWAGAGTTAGGTLMRRVAGVEMLGLYLGLALLPYAVWRWRRRVELYVLLAYALGMMLVYGAAVTNVGALYRFRYGFIMMLFALGLAAGLSARRPPPAADAGDRPDE